MKKRDKILIEQELDLAGVSVKHKRSSLLMRFIALFIPRFLTDFWTTVGPRTIYAPDDCDLTKLEEHATILRHELTHIRQARKYPGFWQLSYLLLPVPIGFAWFRWRWEREAYLVDIREKRLTIEQVVSILHTSYLRPWPRKSMRKWFEKELSR